MTTEKFGAFTFIDGVAYVIDKSGAATERLKAGPIQTPFLEAIARRAKRETKPKD